MTILLLNGYGMRMHVDKACLKIKDGRYDDSIEPEEYIYKPKRIDIDHIVVYGQSGIISVDAIRWLMKHNVQISVLDWNGKLLTTMLPPEGVSVDVKFAQYQASNNEEKRIYLARRFVEAKFDRQQAVLDWLKSKHPQINNDFSNLCIWLRKARTVKELIFAESVVAAFYWKEFAKVIPDKYGFESRKNTTNHIFGASDKVNAMLNYGYALLEGECLRAINSIGLDRHVGFLHEIRPGSSPLAYDVQELFRFIVDVSVINLIENNSMKDGDFVRTDNYSLKLRSTGARKVTSEFNKQMGKKVDYINKDTAMSYLLFLKVRELSQFLTGKKSEIDFRNPTIVLNRMDTEELREKIKGIGYYDWKKKGLSKGTLHYLKKNAKSTEPFYVKKGTIELLNGF